MSEAWDTTVASRLAPGNDYELHLLERAAAGDRVGLTAPTVLEVSYGLAKAADHDESIRAAQAWFTRLVTSELVVVHPLDETAAVLAGRLRARQPIPPTSARARKGSRPDQRVGWLLDIQIAACAWTSGSSVCTENLRDYERLRNLIGELYPDTPPLVVQPFASWFT